MLKDKASSLSKRMREKVVRLKVYCADKRKTMRYIVYIKIKRECR